jgi:hypothetical protein
MGGNVTDWEAAGIQMPGRLERRLWRGFPLGLHGRARRLMRDRTAIDRRPYEGKVKGGGNFTV